MTPRFPAVSGTSCIRLNHQSELYPMSLVCSESTVTITEMDGTVLSDQIKNIGFESLWWFSLVHEFPETIGKRGIIHFAPVVRFDGRVAGFSLQFTPNAAFTAITPFER